MMARLMVVPWCLLLFAWATAGDLHPPHANHGLHFTNAVQVWDEALPLGNGILGALVWGDGQPMKISLDRTDLWDLTPVPEFQSANYNYATMRQWHEQGRHTDLVRVYEAPYHRPAPTKIPAGRIEMTLAVGAKFLAAAEPDKALASEILADPDLPVVLAKARELLRTGLNAGSGYGEIWIRDLNTFIELALEANEPSEIRGALLTFLKFQGTSGDIPDGFIPKERGSVDYKYRKSPLAPGLLAHKNTVETDQESSLVQAVRKYVTATGDRSLLEEPVDGRRVIERLGQALDYVMTERFDPARGLVWGATTVDWGDVQPEHQWGVELDDGSHRAIDIYDNAMLAIAIDDYLQLLDQGSSQVSVWKKRHADLKRNIRKHLWDAARQKFIPHLYLGGSPFPNDFDEAAIHYHGGTAVAIEAGILTRDEIARSLRTMIENVRKAGASSIGLTAYPAYPKGSFKNPSMGPYSYQNGGDWCWFGGRMVQQLIRHGFVREAHSELKPMVARVRQHGDFYEWWSLDNQPRGSKQYRGSAGVLGKAIKQLLAWAEENGGKRPQQKNPLP